MTTMIVARQVVRPAKLNSAENVRPTKLNSAENVCQILAENVCQNSAENVCQNLAENVVETRPRMSLKPGREHHFSEHLNRQNYHRNQELSVNNCLPKVRPDIRALLYSRMSDDVGVTMMWA